MSFTVFSKTSENKYGVTPVRNDMKLPLFTDLYFAKIILIDSYYVRLSLQRVIKKWVELCMLIFDVK